MDIFSLVQDVNFSDDQKAAINNIESNTAIIAVPGSGKTAVFVMRVANLLLNHKVKPSEILLLTYSKAATNDMKKRFLTWFGKHIPEAQVPAFSTIHAFSYKLIKKYYGNKFKLIEGGINEGSESKIQILKGIYLRVNNEYLNEETADVLQNKISCYKNLMITPDMVDKDEPDIPKFKEIYQEYEKAKEERGYIDFDDMLEKAYLLIKNNELVRQSYQDTYRFIQVDECQDSSKLQNELIKMLYCPGMNVFMVGDDDQSIYRFRGASPKDFLEFEQNYDNAKLIYLDKNFRSTEQIIQTSNKFIEQNKERYAKSISGNRGPGEKIRIEACPNEEGQVNLVLEKIKGVLEEGEKTLGILYRNNISGVPFASRLLKEGIPFDSQSSNLKSFFSYRTVVEVLCLLKFAIDPGDVMSFEKVYMKHYISKATFEKAKAFNVNEDIIKKLFIVSENNDFNKVTKLKADYQAIQKLKVRESIAYIEDKFYARRGANFSDFKYTAADKQIFSVLKFLAKDVSTIEEFILYMKQLFSAFSKQEKPEGKPRLYLSTIHSSKGLEWDSVFLVDMLNEIFPSSHAMENKEAGLPEDYEEERRLFYVGMTRARDNLVLSFPKKFNGKDIYPSVFINEFTDVNKPAKSSEKEALATPKIDRQRVSVGETLQHKTFGVGKVMNVSKENIVIKFATFGVKTFVNEPWMFDTQILRKVN